MGCEASLVRHLEDNMSPEKDAELVKKYPLLYAQREMSMHDTCMCWGFECGDGWYGIIDRLSAKLEAINNEIKAEREAHSVELDAEPHDDLCFIEASQVKEKFGGLRFYLGPVLVKYDEQVYQWIEEAEAEAEKTCENCGKPGKPNSTGWIITLCDGCKKERDDKRRGKA